MVIIVSQKQSPLGLLLVISDKAIQGQKIEEGKLQLDLTKSFYQGQEMEKEQAQQLFPQARYIHFTGKEAVALGVESGFVDSRKILYVKNIPHAEVIMG